MPHLRSLAICASLLTGCAQLDAKVNMDVDGAVALAQATGDTQAATCYAAIKPLFANAPAGLLSTFELTRAGQGIVEGPCSSVFAGLSLHLLNKLPYTP